MVSFSIEGVLTKLQYYTSTKLYRFKKLDKKYKNNDIVQDTSLILSSNAQSSEAQAANINVNNPQIWTNTEQGIKIQFAYQPQKPILDQPTELKFVVQNLKTGDYLKNLVANIFDT